MVLAESRQTYNKPLPCSPESEKVVIGAVIINNDLIARLFTNLKPEDFYLPLYSKIFKAMISLFEKSKNIDPIQITEELKLAGHNVDALGGISTIVQTTHGLPHFSKLDSFVKIIKEKSLARDIVKRCSLTISTILDEEEEVSLSLDNHEQGIYELRGNEGNNGFVAIKPLLEQSINETKARARSESKMRGISTGFRDLDQVLSGLQKSKLYIIAGRPSIGKTTEVMNIATNVCKALPEAVVAFFTMEVSKEELTENFICSEAKVDAQRYKNAFLTREEWLRADEAIRVLESYKIKVDDTANINCLEIKAKCRRLLAEEKRIDLIVVDYLQLMGSSGKKQKENRQQEVSTISRELKQLAKELNVPVIALSQLSRTCEERKPPRPIMIDLKESGGIEENADCVILLYREDYYDKNSDNKGKCENIVAKNRGGVRNCTVYLSSQLEYGRFENYFGG